METTVKIENKKMALVSGHGNLIRDSEETLVGESTSRDLRLKDDPSGDSTNKVWNRIIEKSKNVKMDYIENISKKRSSINDEKNRTIEESNQSYKDI